MRDKLISWGIPPERIHYLPNGIERDRFSQIDLHQVAELKYQLGLIDQPVIAYVGSLSLPSHPVDLLLKAFSNLLQFHPDAVLLLVGGGEDITGLKNLAQRLGIEHAVRFIGRVASEQVPLYYRLAKVSVDPVYDNDAARGRCPLKLFESWACGIPIVTADVGDRRMLLRGESGDLPAGLFVMPGDYESLAKGISQVLRQPDLANSVVAAGQQRIQGYYWDILSTQLLDFYITYEQRYA
jgi:glycosyltransferase involved in cell wall biosynthesis